MEKNNKLIILLLLVIVIVPLAYFGLTLLEKQIFYDSIKKISDMENQSDATGDTIRNTVTPSLEEYRDFCLEAVNTTSTEILMLQELKDQTFTESYREFIDIQINRLNSENRTYSAMLDKADIYQEYKDGQIGANRGLSLMNDKNIVIDSYANKTSEYKVEADSFLTRHTEMKDKLYELGIDEDFLYNQIEEVKMQSVY